MRDGKGKAWCEWCGEDIDLPHPHRTCGPDCSAELRKDHFARREEARKRKRATEFARRQMWAREPSA